MKLTLADWLREHELWCHCNVRNLVMSMEERDVWITVTYRNGWTIRGILQKKVQ